MKQHDQASLRTLFTNATQAIQWNEFSRVHPFRNSHHVMQWLREHKSFFRELSIASITSNILSYIHANGPLSQQLTNCVFQRDKWQAMCVEDAQWQGKQKKSITVGKKSPIDAKRTQLTNRARSGNHFLRRRLFPDVPHMCTRNTIKPPSSR